MAEKEPKTVEEILAAIEELKTNRSDISNKILELQSRLRVYDKKPELNYFDYKDAILAAFRSQEDGVVLKIGAIEQHILSQYGFAPDKNTLAARIAYLIDRDNEKPIERVKGRRGFYRLRPTKTQTAGAEIS